MTYYVVAYFNKPNMDTKAELQELNDNHHITLYPSFELEKDRLPALVQAVKVISESYNPIHVSSLKDEKFYSRTLSVDVPVKIMKKSRVLETIHYELDELIKRLSGTPNHLSFIRENYTPHVSHFDENLELVLKYIGISENTSHEGSFLFENISNFSFDKKH